MFGRNFGGLGRTEISWMINTSIVYSGCCDDGDNESVFVSWIPQLATESTYEALLLVYNAGICVALLKMLIEADLQKRKRLLDCSDVMRFL